MEVSVFQGLLLYFLWAW